MDALAYCNAAELSAIFSAQPAMASCETETQEVPLHVVAGYFCIMPECLGALKVLLTSGADPNSQGGDRILSRTALHLLADRSKPGDCGVGDEQLATGMRVMVDAGADPHQEDYERRSPIELARHRGASKEILNSLGDDSPASSSDEQSLAPDATGDATEADTVPKGTETSTADLNVGMIAVAAAAVAVVLGFILWSFIKCQKASKRTPPTYSAAGHHDPASTAGLTPTPGGSHHLQGARSGVSSKSKDSINQEATGMNPGPMIIVAPGR